MKLNFLKVLNNQNNTPEEIAEQVVGLEQKQIEYEKQLEALRVGGNQEGAIYGKGGSCKNVMAREANRF